MRNVMYPSASQDKVTSPSATGSKRSRGSGSVQSTSRSGAAASTYSAGTGYIGRVSENGTEDNEARERPVLDRRNSSGKTPTANDVAAGKDPSTPSPAASSTENPPSLDPYLPEPTTHAKIGDPDSDDEGSQDGDKRDRMSQVQERDFADKDGTGGKRPAGHARDNVGDDSQETQSRSASSASSRPLILTSRFEHQVTDDGEILILTGREGQLMNCEDEVSR